MAKVESEWFGDEIAKEIERATVEGLETVAADFVRTAHPLTPYREGFLDRSTKWDSVKRHADGSMSLEMGSFDIAYAEAQEKGWHTEGLTGVTFHEGAHMYQRSADETWPKLDDRIKSAMRHPAV